MNAKKQRRAMVGILLGFAAHAGAAGLELIQVSDHEITLHLDAATTGDVRLLEIEPYDTLNPLRGLTSDRPDCQLLDLANEGFLRLTFPDPAPAGFDPQIQFPAHRVNAGFVGQFSMRARASGTQGGADMPFRIFGLPAFVDMALPADGEWHIVRADMTVTNWSGMRTLRIDPANAQPYAANANAVLDIDWVAMTYRNDFDGGRNHTGLDVFIDLGVPAASWSGAAQPEIVLPRFDGPRDRLYAKYILTAGGTNQIGSARYVTDLSGLSYQTTTTQGWNSRNVAAGMDPATAADGVLRVAYNTPTATWDPGIQVEAVQRVNLDVAQELALKYRITGYTGSAPTLPAMLFGFVQGETGNAKRSAFLVPDGEWHVYRVRLDQSTGTLSWHGNVQLRLDVPEGTGYPAAQFAGAALEIDWIAASDDPLFTPSRPLVAGGRCWTFAEDRTAPLLAARTFKGMDGSDYGDKIDLGAHINKMNFVQRSAIDLSLAPAVTWPVDEFQIGINQTYINNTMKPAVKQVSDAGMATVITSLGSLQDYWLGEGTPDQRFNPLRNYLTATNSPNTFSVAHNVMDPVGLAYYRGVLEYLGRYFSDPSGNNGQIFRYTIGNEVDQHWAWYNLGEIEMEEVVEIYLTSCRIADLALRSQHPDYRIYLSFTHYWDKLGGIADPLKCANMRDFLDRFAARAKEEGDFPWALCIHPYPVNLRNQEFWNDTEPTDDFNTEYITFKNLQVARRYLQQQSMLYNGQVRTINLGEQGFDVKIDGDPLKEAVQAAALAYSFKIVEQVPEVEAYLYHRQIDHPDENNLLFGVWADDPDTPGQQAFRKRPSWFVMQAYGTTNEAAVLDPYLAYLPLSDWSQINLADIKLQYEFNAPDPGIYTLNLPANGTSNGVFAGTVAHNDPQIINTNVNTYGDGQETALLRIKTGKTGNWQLFWRRAGDTGYSAARSITFPVAATGGFGFCQVDLSTNADWVGKNIKAWRLDPAGSATPYAFEIDWMRFGPKGDFDGDGIPDAEEGLADPDGDGLPNMADSDSNGNGYSDARERLLGLAADSDDSDADGLPNEWEIQYGFDPFDNLEADWDLDGDGFHTLAEHIAVTDPTNALSYFAITGLEGGTNVQVYGRAGRSYALWSSTNLVAPAWRAVDAAYAPVDMPLSLVDTNRHEAAFYRLDVAK